MNLTVLDRLQKELKTKELRLQKLNDKFSRLDKQLDSLYEEVGKLREAYKILSSSGSILGHSSGCGATETSGEPLLGTRFDRSVQGEEGATKATPSKPTEPPVLCPTCNGVNTLYKTVRTTSAGKEVPLLACSSCMTEKIAYS